MKDDMKIFQLEQKAHKGTQLVKGYDDINGVLDDQIVKTQAMLGSSHIGKGKLKGETNKWVTTLNALSDLIEEMLKTQRTWMYLEPIFSSDDIMVQMPNEGTLFRQVDTSWREIMTYAFNDPPALTVFAKEGFLEELNAANDKLEQVQKGLNDYLMTKRLYFPRFFFLSNDELLEILAETKDRKSVV